MAHPIMYDEDDPWLGRLRELCARLPDTVEKVAHGRPTFRAGEKGRVYAYFGGSVKQPGGHERHDAGLMVKPDPAERAALEQSGRTWYPAYLGPSGWLGLDLDDPALDWEEVAELLDASYRQVASRTLLARLDEGSAHGG